MYLCRIIRNHCVMKKFYIFLALVLCGFSQMIYAQNMYRNYQSNNIRKPTSAVSVVHSNGYVYFFQSDGMGKLSATEIDPLSMNTIGNDIYFDMTQQNFNLFLNGGFEDANGRIVLFGYRKNGSTKNPAYVIISSSLLSCDAYTQGIYGEYTAGCDGFDQYSGEVYMFVNDKTLVAYYTVSLLIPYTFELDVATHPVDHYSDISWDAVHKKFIASGFASDPFVGLKDPFVQVFDYVNNMIVPIAEYCVLNNTYTHSNEYKTLHVQLDDNNMILYYDLRHDTDTTTHDIIWLARISNFWDINTVTVLESWLYELPNAKLSAKDMIYDAKNNRLNFLGYINHCTTGLTHILAQADPYMLSSGIEIGQLGAVFVGDTCHNYQYPTELFYYNDLEMFNLAWNYYNPCFPVLIAGVGGKNSSFLTETYELSLSSCDKPMWHMDTKADTIIKPYSHSYTYPIFQMVLITSDSTKDNITVSYICNEQNACSHQFGGKSQKKDIHVQKSATDIIIIDNKEFVCEGFNGEIQYYIYDIAGKSLQRGMTRNHERNSIKNKAGIYLLKAFDSFGNLVVKKIILL